MPLPPLRCDPSILESVAEELAADARSLPPAPPPLVMVGEDAASAAINVAMPTIYSAVFTLLPSIRAGLGETASKIAFAALAYASSDRRRGTQLARQ
ncbi:hypothetical protein MB901379_01358 [Mycobacterium basiliense]|uniref:PE family protein n=1 Tax=Mycobacterium basiliense TaxID=2094119 RepID=A0A447GBF9_9MYCO|nr:hypothetical protein MB901379_01358 [Mycobacterium basiliense]